MARLPLLPLLLLLPLLPLAACARLGPGVNGGFGCLGCVIAVGMVQQLSEIHNDSISSAMARLCGVLPETHNLRASCQILLQVFGPSIIWMLNTEVTPDVVCHALALCRRDPGEAFCHVFPLPRGGLHQAVEAARRLAPGSPVPDKFLELSGICSLPKIRDLCELIRRCWSHHIPAQDGDGDLFSTVPVFRGSHWRGRDCADRSADVHPGRRPSNQDAFEDSNCNGIWGVDPADGVAYEKKFCESSRPRGLVLLGDSAGAHFHIPAAWMTGELLSPEAFSNLPVALANELDWPQLSAFTGFMNSSWASITSRVLHRQGLPDELLSERERPPGPPRLLVHRQRRLQQRPGHGGRDDDAGGDARERPGRPRGPRQGPAARQPRPPHRPGRRPLPVGPPARPLAPRRAVEQRRHLRRCLRLPRLPAAAVVGVGEDFRNSQLQQLRRSLRGVPTRQDGRGMGVEGRGGLAAHRGRRRIPPRPDGPGADGRHPVGRDHAALARRPGPREPSQRRHRPRVWRPGWPLRHRVSQRGGAARHSRSLNSTIDDLHVEPPWNPRQSGFTPTRLHKMRAAVLG
ncbi:acyloxyacyl hydrolase isoform X2 [Lampetra fluviatilis]